MNEILEAAVGVRDQLGEAFVFRIPLVCGEQTVSESSLVLTWLLLHGSPK